MAKNKKRVLMHVFDSTKLDSFARSLIKMGWEIIAVGKTAEFLQRKGIKVTSVDEIIDLPLLLKAILARRRSQVDMKQLQRLKIRPIDMMVVNFAPFENAIQKAGVSFPSVIKWIDISRVTLARAAAKNCRSVTVVTEVDQYARVFRWLQQKKNMPLKLRQELAFQAFLQTALYETVIAYWFWRQSGTSKLPDEFAVRLRKIADFRRDGRESALFELTDLPDTSFLHLRFP